MGSGIILFLEQVCLKDGSLLHAEIPSYDQRKTRTEKDRGWVLGNLGG